MAQKKLEKLRSADLEELYSRLNDLNAEHIKMLSLIKAGGSLEKPGKIRHLKRQRARILTIIREREGKEGG